jgi:AcrR family transcriptional regulator
MAAVTGKRPSKVTTTEGAGPTHGLTKGEISRQAILDAAVRRFGADGFRSSSVAEIARDAEVSGTLAYAYFASKEDLFLAALDQDVALLIREGVTSILDTPGDQTWRNTLIFSLVGALDQHPLARRVLAGLEPQVTGRMIELPALNELRVAVAERLRSDRRLGIVRSDVDLASMGRGIVSIYVSLLMAVVQFGNEGIQAYGADVMNVLAAAIAVPSVPLTGGSGI